MNQANNDGVNKYNINWFPGHMQKAKRQMQESLKLVDIVIELRDARIPYSSENPMLKDLIGQKPRLIVLTKKDMADPVITEEWIAYFKENNCRAIAIDSNHDDLKRIIPNLVKEMLADKLARAKARGIRKKVLRAMVVGIPNVGKSTLINGVVRKKVAKTENRPGVTKSLQWIKLNEDVELLDTPGVLWPRFKDERVAFNLALVGSMNDQVVDLRTIVLYALEYLKKHYANLLKERFAIEIVEESSFNTLKRIAASKQFLKQAGELDIDRTVEYLITELRNDKVGKISWERVDEIYN